MSNMTKQEVFDTDLARMNAAIEAAGAVITEDDGFQWIDEAKISTQLMSAYQGLTRYGYANGLI